MKSEPCEGCQNLPMPGVRWPSASNGDETRSWVERCDECQKYSGDVAAAVALALHFMAEGKQIVFGVVRLEPSTWHQPYLELPA